MLKSQSQNLNDKLQPRPPVVVILGHIDHGKTTLLSAIKKMKAPQEEGGITQSIGAYEVLHQGKKITFIDTPGHEVFAAMREKGAQIADIALLVVAADEGVRSQTKEALENIKNASLPFIVVINKIDKKEADINKAKQELSSIEIFVEGWGGSTPIAEVSAITRKGIDELLDLINLLAEVEELTINPGSDPAGFIIDSSLDSRRGPVATLIIKEGVLKVGDFLVAGNTFGKIKNMRSFEGNELKEAAVSQPVSVTGLNEVPSAGENFFKVSGKKEALERIQNLTFKKEERPYAFSEKKPINIIVKADSLAQVEACALALENIKSENFEIRTVKKEAGSINENDIKMAGATSALVFGFKVSAQAHILDFAQRHNVKILSSSVIYELIDIARKEIARLLGPRITKKDLGVLKVLAVFGKKEENQYIIGGEVIKGKIIKGAKFDIKRNESQIGCGEIIELQKDKVSASEVGAGAQCGILYKSKTKIEIADTLSFYEEEAQSAL